MLPPVAVHGVEGLGISRSLHTPGSFCTLKYPHHTLAQSHNRSPLQALLLGVAIEWHSQVCCQHPLQAQQPTLPPKPRQSRTAARLLHYPHSQGCPAITPSHFVITSLTTQAPAAWCSHRQARAGLLLRVLGGTLPPGSPQSA